MPNRDERRNSRLRKRFVVFASTQPTADSTTTTADTTTITADHD